MLFPLVIIFLVLLTFDWNRRQNLFYDAWFVYLVWMGATVCFCLPVLGVGEYKITSDAVNLALFYTSVLSLQTVAVAGVLLWRSNRVSEYVPLTEVTKERPQARGIWKTAILVSVLTSLMMLGLAAAIDDIDQRINPRDRESITFGIYDIS